MKNAMVRAAALVLMLLAPGAWAGKAQMNFESLPLDLAVKVQRGNGKRVLAMFSDPYCPACRRFERSLQPRPGVPDTASPCDDPVDKVLKLGRSLGVNSTPTLILANGARVTGGLAAPDLRELLDQASVR
jgi:thiol:disulfide interchange protein DsbC